MEIPNKKDLALNLIKNLEDLAAKTEGEIFRLNKLVNPRFNPPAGKGALEYHLGILKELVEEL